MKIDVSVIIVNYNTKDLLRDCINSIKEQTKNISFEIIVSDNGSSDGSIEMLKAEFSKVIILNNKENIGGWMYLFEDRLCFFAHGINITTGAIIIPYKDMLEVTPGSRARRIAITTNDGNTGEFLVNESKEWLEILQSKITTLI